MEEMEMLSVIPETLEVKPTPPQPERALADVLNGMWGRIDQTPHTDINNRRAGKPAAPAARQQHVSVKPDFKAWRKAHRAKKQVQSK